MDEVREYGQYVLWYDDDRKIGYTSDCIRNMNRAVAQPEITAQIQEKTEAAQA